MRRRSFLSGVAAVGLAACADGGEELPVVDTGDPPVPTGPVADPGVDLDTEVPRSLTTSANGRQELTLNLISGELPEGWAGHGMFVHAEPRPGTPVFTGEARVVRLDFRPGEVGLVADTLKTPGYYADRGVAGGPHAFARRDPLAAPAPLD